MYNINKYILLSIVKFFLIFLFIPSVVHAFPNTVNYQGYLTINSDGLSISGTIDMIFSIYDSKIDDEPLWREEHFGVPVNKGYFDIKLGSQNEIDFSTLPSDKDLYIGISVGGEEMGERVKLNSVIHSIFSKYSLEAKTVAFNSITSEHIKNGTISSSDIALNGLTGKNLSIGAINTEQIKSNAVTADKISSGLPEFIINQYIGKKSSIEILGEDMENGTAYKKIQGDNRINRKSGQCGTGNGNVISINQYSWYSIQISNLQNNTKKIIGITLPVYQVNTAGMITIRLYEGNNSNHGISKELGNKSFLVVKKGDFNYEFDSSLSIDSSKAHFFTIESDSTLDIKLYLMSWSSCSSECYAKYYVSNNSGNNWRESSYQDEFIYSIVTFNFGRWQII